MKGGISVAGTPFDSSSQFQDRVPSNEKVEGGPVWVQQGSALIISTPMETRQRSRPIGGGKLGTTATGEKMHPALLHPSQAAAAEDSGLIRLAACYS